ncbi:MAG: sensor histidine kinase [Chitinophagaceae bacterium]
MQMIMNRWYRKVASILKHYETLLYIGLLCWISIFGLLDHKIYSWIVYLRVLLVLAIVHIPVLLLCCNRLRWKQDWTRKRYLLYWLLCFGVYLPVVFIVCASYLKQGTDLQTLIPLSCLSSLLLELLLLVTAYYQQRVQQWKWIRKLSLERSVLVSIVLISVILSVMAVSSIGNPAYDKEGGLLLGFEFSFMKVLAHFGAFAGFVVQFLLMYLCGYFFFYLNNRILVPMVLKTRGVVIYVLVGLASVGILYPVIAQLLYLLPANARLGNVFSANPFAMENAFGAVLIILLSLPVVLALQWSRQNSRIVALEKEKAETELDLLKQQLNPHFFFNTLNNLYALSLQQSKQTPESILQLSELMRYVIYKAKEPTVKIEEEIKYLDDYIELQQIRLKRKPVIDFNRTITGNVPPIAPLLLIVLVENAFKHGIEPAEEPALLHISLRADERKLYFSCINSFEQQTASGEGIGLANLQRRLALLYPGKHLLKTGIENHTFKAELELDLS